MEINELEISNIVKTIVKEMGLLDDIPDTALVKYKVAIGSDHGGFESKETLKAYLIKIGHIVTDVGTNSKEAVDYPDYAKKVAYTVASKECDYGIMIDGAGIGSCMACNKVKGIRAAMCYNEKTIINSKQHNGANVLTLGGPLHKPEELCNLAKLWLETPFEGGRHQKRIDKIMEIEKE